MPNHYEVLGVRPQAGPDEIRKAYLRLARDRHPDRFTDPAEKEQAQEFFQALTEAFNTLSNERNRRGYDEELARPKLETPEQIAQDAYARSQQKLEERDLDGAIELLRVALHHAPGEAQYHIALARALSHNPHWLREAFQAFEAAVQLEPRHVGYQLELARLLASQGLKLRARKLLEGVLQIAPADPAVLRLAKELELDPGSKAEPSKASGGALSGLRGLFGRKG